MFCISHKQHICPTSYLCDRDLENKSFDTETGVSSVCIWTFMINGNLTIFFFFFTYISQNEKPKTQQRLR